MSGSTSAERALDDARAVLDALVASDWREIHVASDGIEIFAAKVGGRENPMRAAGESDALSSVAAPSSVVEVSAPHVATLHSIKEVGATIAAGARIATLRVLDEERDLLAPSAGKMGARFAEPGDLLEYGQPVASLVEAG